MATEDQPERKSIFHYEGNVPVFDPQGIDDLAREQEEAKKRDAKYRDAQLAVNQRLMVFTGVLAICGILAGGVSVWQAHIANETLTEIRNGKADTNRIITASETQAGTAQKIADASNRNAAAAEKFSGSADSINLETAKAVGQFTRLADATQRAAKTAQDTLHVSERAYIAFGSPTEEFDKKFIHLLITNSGHIPSGKVGIVLYEATFNVPSPVPAKTSFEFIVERHRSFQHLDSVNPGTPFGISVSVPNVQVDRLNNGTQLIMVLAKLSYGDGFPDSPVQYSSICANTIYHVRANQSYLVTCAIEEELPKFESLDWANYTETN